MSAGDSAVAAAGEEVRANIQVDGAYPRPAAAGGAAAFMMRAVKKETKVCSFKKTPNMSALSDWLRSR